MLGRHRCPPRRHAGQIGGKGRKAHSTTLPNAPVGGRVAQVAQAVTGSKKAACAAQTRANAGFQPVGTGVTPLLTHIAAHGRGALWLPVFSIAILFSSLN